MKILRRFFLSVSVIMIFAFLVRMGLLYYLQSHGRTPIVSVLPFGYETGRIGRSIATGNGFSSPLSVPTGPTAWLTPIFPYLLAGIFKLFGVYSYTSFLVIVSINNLFSALTCIPIYFIGKRLGGLSVAAGGAWMWAIFINAILIPIEWVWDTSLAALMAGFVLWATMAIVDSRRVKDWIGYGLLWGAALMTTAAFASVLPFIFGWLAWRLLKLRGRWIQLPAAAALAAALCCVPWTIRNYVVFHQFVPLRSNFGLELWLGNNDQVPDTWAGQLHPNDFEPERHKFSQMGEIAYMKEKQHEAIQFMVSHPRDTMRFFWRRFADTWDPIQDVWRAARWDFRLLLVSNIVVSIFGLAGLLALFREKNQFAFPIAVFPLAFPIVYYVTHSSLRYRHPIDPVLVVLTALAFRYLVSAVVARVRTIRSHETLRTSEASS